MYATGHFHIRTCLFAPFYLVVSIPSCKGRTTILSRCMSTRPIHRLSGLRPDPGFQEPRSFQRNFDLDASRFEIYIRRYRFDLAPSRSSPTSRLTFDFIDICPRRSRWGRVVGRASSSDVLRTASCRRREAHADASRSRNGVSCSATSHVRPQKHQAGAARGAWTC